MFETRGDSKPVSGQLLKLRSGNIPSLRHSTVAEDNHLHLYSISSVQFINSPDSLHSPGVDATLALPFPSEASSAVC